MLRPYLESNQASPITNLIDLCKFQSRHSPSKVAYYFLKNEGMIEREITYSQLDMHASHIASQLQLRNLSGERVLLLMPSDISFIEAFFGCLYAKAIAVPANLTKPGKQGWKRLEAIAANSRAKIILTNRAQITILRKNIATSENLKFIECLSIEDLLEADYATSYAKWIDPKVNSESIAFLQYTSGSTMDPKGVIVTHGNIINNQKIIQTGCLTDQTSIFVSWLPLFHDLGLIGSILHPLYLGAQCFLMPPTAFLQKPIRWLKAISDYKATCTNAPNFAYELCLSKIPQADLNSLNLSSLKCALNGAEPVRAKTLQLFLEKFADYGLNKNVFFPAYGLAEATLVVTGGFYNPEKTQTFDSEELKNRLAIPAPSESMNQRELVSCGKILCDQKVRIVEPTSKTLCRENEIGEIWISGSSVAHGYWNNEESTKAIFQAFINGDDEGPFLRTGDLGFFYKNELFIAGRLKDLIIINGRNYYPQDIEYTSQETSLALKKGGCAAFSVDIEEKERLVIVQEVERSHLNKIDYDELVKLIKKAVFMEHDLEVYKVVLIKPNTLPKTSSGKVQRKNCCKAFLENSFEFVLESSVTEPNALPMESKSKKTEDLILWLRDYASSRINSRMMDERRMVSPHIILDFGNKGLLGMQAPSMYGGLDLTHTDSMKILEQLGAIDQSLALLVLLNNSLGIRPILNHGSTYAKNHYLPLIATGRELAAFALTEPVAGSNPRAIKSTAKPLRQDTWLIEGKKIWSGSAAWAGFTNVFVRQLDEHGMPNGISGFVIPQNAKGLRQGPEALTMGMRGMVQNAIFLDGVETDTKHLLGTLGSGLDVAQDAMTYCRLGIGSFALGSMKKCVQLMHRYAERRTISTGVLLKNPITLTIMSHLLSAILALETLIYKATELLDQGYRVPVDVYSVAKIAGAEFLWEAADHLVQILGGRGYIESNIAPQILRDARVLRIFEGPTATLCMFLGARVLNKMEEMRSFFSLLKNSEPIFNQLVEAAYEIQKVSSQSKHFSDPSSALYWAQHGIGEATVFSLLQACLEDANSKNPSQENQTAIEWTKQKFLQKTAYLLKANPYLMSDQITEVVTSYKHSIGDIEQRLPAEDPVIDEMLRSKTTISTPVPPITSEVKSNYESDEMNEETQDKLLAWLASNLNLPLSSISKEISFSELGLDSISAVSLSQAIQEMWNIEIDPTIAWDFPTVNLLSKYLTSEKMRRENKRINLKGQSESIVSNAQASSYLNLITEEEATVQLSEELRKLSFR